MILLVHPYIALWWKSFPHAGHKSWEALIPGYNYYVAFKIGSKKPWWSILLIFPGVHIAMWSIANTSYIRRFGYYSLVDTLQGIFFPYIIMAKIAQAEKDILPPTNWANSKDIGEREWGDHLALFLTLPVIGHVLALGISAVTRHKPGEKTKVKEWGDSLMFALIAASIIRTYVFEPFQIPTGSMEKTLLVGDFLFVNKLAYGPKVPVTPLSYPLVHNTVPWVDMKSYIGLEKLNYQRLPGFSDVNRNDVVVFNYPSGDTAVYDPRMPNGLMGHDYHGIVIDEAMYFWEHSQKNTEYLNKIKNFLRDSINKKNPALNVNDDKLSYYAKYRLIELKGNDFIDNLDFWSDIARKSIASGVTYCRGGMPPAIQDRIEHYGVIYRPVDKRENYIKRCVGLPKDFVEVKSSILYINDKPAFVSEFQNIEYTVTGVKILSIKEMDEKYGLEAYTYGPNYHFPRRDYRLIPETGAYVMQLTKHQIELLKKDNPSATFTVNLNPQYSDTENYSPTNTERIANLHTFPKDVNVNNTMTDFTRFQIPFKGQTIDLSKDNIAWFRRIITAYEGHTLAEKEDGIYIDGKKVKKYTFAMNYYWMMGDNRYNSADSRVWGFVPEDHIVGKASMVWFSKSPYKGVRWDRLFNIIK